MRNVVYLLTRMSEIPYFGATQGYTFIWLSLDKGKNISRKSVNLYEAKGHPFMHGLALHMSKDGCSLKKLNFIPTTT